MPLEVFRKHPGENKYSEGLTLQEYAESYWLISSRQIDDGRVVHQWVHPSRDKKPTEKALPWKIKLGDSAQEAFDTLAYFGKILRDKL